jgi:hypothetical protein
VAPRFAQVPVHGHRAGLAASMRSPALGVDFTVWQQLARLAGADHVHASGLGSKFYERDDEVAANIRSLQTPLGATIDPLPTLSSGQNVHTPGPTFAAVRSTDLLMLAGGGIAGHPDGPAAGVRSLRHAWAAAVSGDALADVAAAHAARGDAALAHALQDVPGRCLMAQFGFLADDLTGASDVLAQAHASGSTPCWSSTPTVDAGRADVVGIAGPARSLAGTRSTRRCGPAWPRWPPWTCPCCSTRSAPPSTPRPTVGSIGRGSSCCTSGSRTRTGARRPRAARLRPLHRLQPALRRHAARCTGSTGTR